ncbi:MAG: DUF4412 domain-containing protein [Bacteroidales bacterium]|nr:DUF4412 domain-containing protein [Bacteroidales bacterium]
MKKILSLLSILALSGGFFQTQAQVGNYLKNKAKQATVRAGQKSDEKVTEEVNEEVDTGVEKVFNKFFGEDETETLESAKSSETDVESDTSDGENNSFQPASSESSSSDVRANAMMKAMGINTTSVDVKENYNYSGNILMTVQSWDDEGKPEDEIQYKTFMTKDNSGFAMEFGDEGEEESTMIFDYKDEKMIILSDDGDTKSGMVTAYSGLAEQMSDAEEDSEYNDNTDYSSYRQNLKKTGKSKKIAGYKCDEYIYDDEESHIVMWMTDQLPADLMANMFNANVMAGSSMGFYGGFTMEMDQQSKNSKDRTYMLVNEVNENQSTSISTKGYELMSISGMPNE